LRCREGVLNSDDVLNAELSTVPRAVCALQKEPITNDDNLPYGLRLREGGSNQVGMSCRGDVEALVTVEACVKKRESVWMSILLRADACSARADGLSRSAAGMLVCEQAALWWGMQINVGSRCSTRTRSRARCGNKRPQGRVPGDLCSSGKFMDDKHHWPEPERACLQSKQV